MMQLGKMLEEHARVRPDHTAYIFRETETTWKQYDEQANRIANAFLSIGLQPGDFIATLLPQSSAFSNIFAAAAKVGIVLVPLDLRNSVSEMAGLCRRTNPRILLSLAFNEETRKLAESLAEEVRFERVYSFMGSLHCENAEPYENLLEFPADPVPDTAAPAADDPFIVVFTSGTTGRPKGAMISHKNTYAIARATVDSWKISPEDRMLCNLPTSHVGGTHDLLAVQILAGATGVLAPSFDPQQMLQFCSKFGLTVIGGVPTMYRLTFNKCAVKDYDVDSVRLIIVSGEPSPVELIYQINSEFPNATVVASFGMTETSGFFTFTKLDDSLEVVARTEGTPYHAFDMKILRSDGQWAAAGEVGEMLVRGDSVISGYLEPEDNKGSFLDGWHKSGDLGYMDANNYLHCAGRTKEMFISGGYNVYPLEIESYLNAHPKINSSCVIEIPDEIWGEVGCAFVVPEDGGAIREEEIEQYCRDGLADYKRPRKIIVEKDLPRTVVGKVARQEIRKNIRKYLPAD